MVKTKCKLIIVSWALVLFSVFVYEKYGLFAAFVPLAISAFMRNDAVNGVADKLKTTKIYQYIALIYYVVLLIITMFLSYDIAELNSLVFILILSLPFLSLIVIDDMYSCFMNNGE